MGSQLLLWLSPCATEIVPLIFLFPNPPTILQVEREYVKSKSSVGRDAYHGREVD